MCVSTVTRLLSIGRWLVWNEWVAERGRLTLVLMLCNGSGGA
jgi:hypothetical protein